MQFHSLQGTLPFVYFHDSVHSFHCWLNSMWKSCSSMVSAYIVHAEACLWGKYTSTDFEMETLSRVLIAFMPISTSNPRGSSCATKASILAVLPSVWWFNCPTQADACFSTKCRHCNILPFPYLAHLSADNSLRTLGINLSSHICTLLSWANSHFARGWDWHCRRTLLSLSWTIPQQITCFPSPEASKVFSGLWSVVFQFLALSEAVVWTIAYNILLVHFNSFHWITLGFIAATASSIPMGSSFNIVFT